ncbi:hypothetical protein DFJ58DRAFT_823299 [Suillus subalutaceus]|uniref:uncharacterized protein n=1 Tax=Suillus subalutaceus TaxID=48586 RepID=UPI001B87F33E|nr:uncharacterized protein DFJ58DRAFT_823299 [Suillus subalutaceus]KAG1832304.1 hypothetical protein DFJ58DRAFT_823299 [Suillus subalutaceus]
MLTSNVSTWLYLCLAGIGVYLVKQVLNKNPASYHPAPRGNASNQPWLTFAKGGKKYGTILHIEVLGKRIIVINSVKNAVVILGKKTTVYSDRPVRRDSHGNEYITYLFPDGTERLLINGVEQPPNSNPPPSHHNSRAIAASPPSQDPPPPYDAHVVPPPAARSTRLSRFMHSRFRNYARQAQDPNPTYSMQSKAPYASQYADPNLLGHQKKNRTRGGADKAWGRSAWKFWKRTKLWSRK